MGLEVQESLLADLWLKEMENLRNICARESEGSADRTIRRAFHLRALSPAPLRRILPLDIAEHEMEALLEEGQVEAAARALVGREWTVAISPSPIKGRIVAKLQGRRAGILEAAGNCAALAIIGAWTQILTGVPADCTDTTAPANAGAAADCIPLMRTA